MLFAIVETRKIFGGETEVAKIVFYVLALIALAIFFAGFIKRFLTYSHGRRLSDFAWLRRRDPHDIQDVSERPTVPSSLVTIATNRTIMKAKRKVGVSHLLLFWGFIGLFIATS
ncbi:MAG: Fe-S oxidoreductase, partial [Ferrimicrobium acidiphilum]